MMETRLKRVVCRRCQGGAASVAMAAAMATLAAPPWQRRQTTLFSLVSIMVQLPAGSLQAVGLDRSGNLLNLHTPILARIGWRVFTRCSRCERTARMRPIPTGD